MRGRLRGIFTPIPGPSPAGEGREKGLLLKSLPACGEGFRVGLQAFSLVPPPAELEGGLWQAAFPFPQPSWGKGPGDRGLLIIA